MLKVNRNRRGTMSTPGGVGGLRREPHPTRLETGNPQIPSDIIRNHVGEQAHCQGDDTLATAGETHLLGGGGLH